MKLSHLGLCLLGLLFACAPAQSAFWSEAQLLDLKEVAAQAPAEGLAAETTSIREIAMLERLARTDGDAARRLNQVADDLFARLAIAYARGSVDPGRVDPNWALPRATEPDLDALRSQIASGRAPSELLQALLPSSPDYQALRAELTRVSAETDETTQAGGLDRDTRIVRLRANLERLRWMPRDLPARRIEVRINQFEVTYYSETSPPLILATIVGAPGTQTPSFQAELRSITLNPSWEPPTSIVRNELLPRFARDPSAAARQGFTVIDEAGSTVDPGAVDWTARPFRYRLRQLPGPGNALGQVRFDLPNTFAIYLHDTPNRALFDQANRALSHGCIRVKDPAQLAAAVIGKPEWTREAILAAVASGETQTIPLETRMPVLVLYLTAGAAAESGVTYFNDIYERDAELVRALDVSDASFVAMTEPPRSQVTCSR